MRIVITGTSSGIGRHLAGQLAAQGHEIWGLARSVQDAPYATSVCDVANWEQVEKARDAVAQAGHKWTR
jgi:nucleoside-diphosphate-sugar epimerase